MTLSLAEKSRLAMEAVANQISEIQYIQGENTRMVRGKDSLQSQLLRQLSANQLAQQQNAQSQQGGSLGMNIVQNTEMLTALTANQIKKFMTYIRQVQSASPGNVLSVKPTRWMTREVTTLIMALLQARDSSI